MGGWGGTDGGHSKTTEKEGIKAGVRTSAEVSRRESPFEEIWGVYLTVTNRSGVNLGLNKAQRSQDG